MSWKIGSIELPIDPESVTRRVARKQVLDKIVGQLPFAIDTGPEVFELTITGKIWPSSKAFALWELVKKAETPSIEVIVSNDIDFGQYSGRYAVSRAESVIDKPQFIKDGSLTTAVHDYNITLIEYAKPGAFGDGNAGDTTLDEDGVGFGGINVSFGDIKFDFADFIVTIGDIFAS